ncbi:HAD hydrolase family protein [Candidatus Aerophobetes bacterium]|nr:HAD hydrolase family protein [Candidatus Aerophobetes bacterium]
MKQVNLDCEGPITKNDNALELCQYFIPQGERFFSLISNYDDFLADILKRKGYKAGNTLKLILPFLKAYGASDKKIKDYSASHLLFVPKAKKMLSYIRKAMPVFIISTSYQPYIEALCEFLNFPKENSYFTSLNLDNYDIPQEEIKTLKEMAQEIINLPNINLSQVKENSLPQKMKKSIKKLDEIFEDKIPFMKCGKILKEIDPVGGKKKAEAVLDSLKRKKGKLSDVMYVGDSITDVEALKLVKDGGGIAISFNGNFYALKAAQIACISPDTSPLPVLAELFYKKGKKTVLEMITEEANKLNASSTLAIISKDNLKPLAKESEIMRKKVRGEKIGRLG